jgi:hypothetical protein
MAACAEDVLAAARRWWLGANERVRSQLAAPLAKLPKSVAFHNKNDRAPRPAHGAAGI